MNFNFGTVSSTTQRTAKTTTPELCATPTNRKLRLNEAATKLLNVRHGEYVMFISNADAVVEAAEAQGLTGKALTEFLDSNVQYAIAKGVAELRNGKPVIGPKILSKEDREAIEKGEYQGDLDDTGKPVEVKFHGAKLASSTKSSALGQILEFNDAKHYPLLKGNDQTNEFWTIDSDGVDAELDLNGEIGTYKVYPLTYDRSEEKVERTKSDNTAE